MQYFISDCHLAPERPEITQAFFRFLETTASNANALYILGDFFDAWLGDDDDSPLIGEVIKHLAAFTQHTPTFFMHGNRDFLVGEQFAKQTGVSLLAEPTIIEINHTPTLLIHGDSLCTKDEEYMGFRQMVRSSQWQQMVLAKPLDERKALAQQMRATSQSMNSLKADDIMDVTPSEVIKLMEEHNITRLIHGHTHRPARHKLSINKQAGERIVLGDWHQQGWYLQADGEQIDLVSFDIVK